MYLKHSLDAELSKSLLLNMSVEYCCLQQCQVNRWIQPKYISSSFRQVLSASHCTGCTHIFSKKRSFKMPVLIQINYLDVSSHLPWKFGSCLSGRLIDPALFPFYQLLFVFFIHFLYFHIFVLLYYCIIVFLYFLIFVFFDFCIFV